MEYALANDVDLVLLAGDAYKGRDPSQTHQRELARRLARLSAAGVPVFLLVGNHDLPHAVGRATAIEIFRTLQVPNLCVGDQLQTYNVPTRQGPLQIVAVPWPRRSGLLSARSPGAQHRQIREEIERRFTEYIQQCVEGLDPSVPAILAGHVTINGAVTGSERSMMLGQDHVLFPSAVHKPELDYVALGHVHKHQVLLEDPMVVYSGSLQRVDFSEEDDTKGFCVVELDSEAPRGRRMRDFQFAPVNARPFITIDARVEPGDQEPTGTVVKAIRRRSLAGSIIRLRIHVPADLAVHLRDGEIREALSSAHFVAAIIRDVEGYRRTRIPAGVGRGIDPPGMPCVCTWRAVTLGVTSGRRCSATPRS